MVNKFGALGSVERLGAAVDDFLIGHKLTGGALDRPVLRKRPGGNDRRIAPRAPRYIAAKINRRVR